MNLDTTVFYTSYCGLLHPFSDCKMLERQNCEPNETTFRKRPNNEVCKWCGSIAYQDKMYKTNTQTDNHSECRGWKIHRLAKQIGNAHES